MDTLEAIHSRRSVRDFTAEPVDDTVVEELLRAAMAAPSANNGQPWSFIVLRDLETRERIAALRPGQAPLVKAPLGIAILAASAGYQAQWWAIDCSLAAQNLVLAAQARGLGTVWIGVWPDVAWVSGVGEVLGVTDGVVVHSIIALGHPSRVPAPVDRFDPARVDWR